ncbi:hypothetical protein GWK47_028666 [Chionoecetes opilio]|uniref:Uncharacterized protein n=1 Tax=Chionoecetes opilio TaxID=41210 RepID=A0A8J4YNW0_CHIOP|nr:hypothetical protein GWK47_028666 [Chionoecetes opilio]
MLERFTVVIYDKTSPLVSVNEARKELFCQKNRTMENIPPTQQALLQHTKRAVYQAGIWTTCHQAQQQTPTAEGCGWTLDAETKSWVPVWSSQPAAAKAVSELVKCACKSAAGCGGRCSCKKPAGNAPNCAAANVRSRHIITIMNHTCIVILVLNKDMAFLQLYRKNMIVV